MWIKCSDRMPENYKCIIFYTIVFNMKNVVIGQRIKEGTWITNCMPYLDPDIYDKHVTHWQPLPEYPID